MKIVVIICLIPLLIIFILMLFSGLIVMLDFVVDMLRDNKFINRITNLKYKKMSKERKKEVIFLHNVLIKIYRSFENSENDFIYFSFLDIFNERYVGFEKSKNFLRLILECSIFQNEKQISFPMFEKIELQDEGYCFKRNLGMPRMYFSECIFESEKLISVLEKK